MNKNKSLAKAKQSAQLKKKESHDDSSSSSSSSSSGSSSSSSKSSSSSTKIKPKRKCLSTEKAMIGGEEGEIDSDAEKALLALPEDIATKLKSLTKLTEKTRADFEKHQHKLEKIERAHLKAQKENNKVNMKKCFKYKQKYETKVEKLKSNLKLLQNKRIKLQQQLDAIESNKKIAKPDDGNKKPAPAPATKTVIKLPFPVLNDTRDMKIILGTLETKQVELINKIEQNRFSLGDKQASYQKLEKLKQLEKAYESQLEKINIQLDYLRLALNLEALRERNVNQPPHMMMMSNQQIMIDQMANRLNEMYNMMKAENKSYLKQHQQQHQQSNESRPNDLDNKNQSTAQVSPPKVTQPQPIDKLNKLEDIVNQSLAAVIAHTAATAHAAAAIAVTNYYLSAYYNQQQPVGSEKPAIEIEPAKPVVPLKKELENASSIFAKYKDKISSFFINTQKVEEESKKPVDNTGLKLLMSNYGEDAEMSDNESEEKIAKAETKIETKLATTRNESPDSEEDEESDDSDYEIITTSELKQANSTIRNYLLPSLKASYFPLKASIHEVNQLNDRSLIAVEKTKNALTFLGNGVSGQKKLKLNDILFN